MPVVAAGIVIEVLLRRIPNDYQQKKEYLDAHAPEIETLVLGSSHGMYGFNPAFFSGHAFNAAYVSQTLDYDLQILEKYSDRLTSLNTIVLPISYFTLYERLGEELEAWRIKNYMIYYEMNTANSLIDYTEVLSNQFVVNYDRLVSYYYKGESDLRCNRLGWDSVHTAASPKELGVTGRASALRHTVPDRQGKRVTAVFKDNLRILARMAAWSADRNVKLVLVTTPAFETYRENMESEQWRITIDIARGMATQYSNVRYYNLIADPAFTAEDFSDADHLSQKGAEKLSRLINQKLFRQ